MARSTEDAPLTTKGGRADLDARHQAYWRTIEGGAALGYRKGARGGVWLVRVSDPAAGGGYRQGSLGRADDVLNADGAEVLDFKQADRKAREWIARHHRIRAGLEPEPPKAPAKPYTVAEAVTDHLADLEGRGGKSVPRTRMAADAHIVPALGALPVAQLTRKRISDWLQALAKAPPRLRAKPGEVRARAVDPTDEEASRRRRSSANRVLTILKAALNHARASEKVTGPNDAWAMVKPFKGADSPKVRYLTEEECKRLVEACPPDFRDLVTAALLTGCRYGELAALRAGDFDANAATVWIAESKNGKARHVSLTAQGKGFFARKTAGLPAKALVFTHEVQERQAGKERPAKSRRAPWGKTHQFRPMQAASEAAGILPHASFHVLRHTYASRLAMRNAPMQVIAKQLGHADTRVTERHYAHFSHSYVAEAVNTKFGHLDIFPEDGRVVRFPAGRSETA
jgi:integrase